MTGTSRNAWKRMSGGFIFSRLATCGVNFPRLGGFPVQSRKFPQTGVVDAATWPLKVSGAAGEKVCPGAFPGQNIFPGGCLPGEGLSFSQTTVSVTASRRQGSAFSAYPGRLRLVCVAVVLLLPLAACGLTPPPVQCVPDSLFVPCKEKQP